MNARLRDGDGDGLLKHRGARRTGLASQGWKDSHDSPCSGTETTAAAA